MNGFSLKNNYPLTILCRSLGCRVNQEEINQIKKDLIKAGFLPFASQNFPFINKYPDIIILNTCVVTKKAERETRKEIRHLKRIFPQSFLLATGCAVEAQKKLGIKLPEADLFIGNQDKEKIPEILAQKPSFTKAAKGYPSFAPQTSPPGRDKFSPPIKQMDMSIRRWVKIQDGCNQFCTFCIVPYLRNQLKSKPVTQIIREIKKLEKEGILEINLCGINLSLFGQDLKPKTDLVELLKNILQKTNISRLSLSSLTPNLINKKLINLYTNDWRSGSKRLSFYFHIALQSGSKKILIKMNRPKTDLNKLKDLLQYIKQEIPQFNLRADIIVGFPDETENDFQETLHYIEEVKIAFAHIFRYSPRPGTIAYKMTKNNQWQEISEKIKKERSKKVSELVKKIRREEAEKLVGKKLNCLIIGKKKNYWRGLTENFWEVKITCPQSPPPGGPKRCRQESQRKLPKKIIPIQITSYQNEKLFGRYKNN